jgi:hypothetical protein
VSECQTLHGGSAAAADEVVVYARLVARVASLSRDDCVRCAEAGP